MNTCAFRKMVTFKYDVLKTKGIITGGDLPHIDSPDSIWVKAYQIIGPLYNQYVPSEEHNNLIMQFLTKSCEETTTPSNEIQKLKRS